MLSTFTTVADIASSEPIVDLAPYVVAVLLKAISFECVTDEERQELDRLVTDCTHVIHHTAAASPYARHILLQSNAVSVVSQLIASLSASKQAAVVRTELELGQLRDACAAITTLLTRSLSDDHRCSSAHLVTAITSMATVLHARNDALKFEACRQLSSLVQFVDAALDGQASVRHAIISTTNNEWLKNVTTSLLQLLCNKLGPNERQEALQLASAVTSLFESVQWVLHEHDTSLLAVLVNIVCIECRMHLEDCSLPRIQEDQQLLLSAFIVVEHTIKFLANSAVQETSSPAAAKNAHSIGFETVLKLQRPVGDTAASILHMCDTLNDQVTAGSTTPSLIADASVIRAAFRVLGVWLAEETNVNVDDVVQALPLIVRVIGVETVNSDEILLFLLPGLTHITADLVTLSVIIDCNGHLMLLSTLSRWLKGASDDDDNRVQGVCGVLLNVLLLAPQSLSPSFHRDLLDATHRSVAALNKGSANDISITSANLMTLSLFAMSALAPQSALDTPNVHIKHVTRFIVSAPVMSDWSDVEDLWRLSVHAFGKCIQFQPQLRSAAANMMLSDHISTALEALSDGDDKAAMQQLADLVLK